MVPDLPGACTVVQVRETGLDRALRELEDVPRDAVTADPVGWGERRQSGQLLSGAGASNKEELQVGLGHLVEDRRLEGETEAEGSWELRHSQPLGAVGQPQAPQLQVPRVLGPAPPEPTAQANLDVDRPQPRARSPRSGRLEDSGLRGQRAATAANEVDQPGSKLTADPGGSGWRGSQGCMTLRLKEVTGTAVDWVLETGQWPPPPSLSSSRPASLLPYHVPRLPQMLLLGATWKWSPIQLIGSKPQPCPGHPPTWGPAHPPSLPTSAFSGPHVLLHSATCPLPAPPPPCPPQQTGPHHPHRAPRGGAQSALPLDILRADTQHQGDAENNRQCEKTDAEALLLGHETQLEETKLGFPLRPSCTKPPSNTALWAWEPALTAPGPRGARELRCPQDDNTLCKGNRTDIGPSPEQRCLTTPSRSPSSSKLGAPRAKMAPTPHVAATPWISERYGTVLGVPHPSGKWRRLPGSGPSSPSIRGRRSESRGPRSAASPHPPASPLHR
ncbi:uncharacterized protein [Pseudorca crassidens]|uniref:uncharacterized protein n=1 Tax=Pseudorca crassidens TaxID=82174 RepID=UPI00352F14CF